MLLSNLNIQDLVTEHLLNYITQHDFSFQELKQNIINKAPISQVQSKIITILSDYKKQDLAEVQKNIEQQAYKTQLIDDEKEKEYETKKNLNAHQEKATLNQELNDIPKQIREHEDQCIHLLSKINQLRKEIPIETVHQHHTSSNISPHLVSQNDSIPIINPLEKKLLDHELKINTLTQRLLIINSKLQDINRKIKKYTTHQIERQFREQARIGYNTTGEGIFDTLSVKNKEHLRKNTQTQNSAMEKKLAVLIKDSEQINYPIYFDQLLNQLPKLNLPGQETDALRHLFKFMDHHFNYEHQAVSIGEKLKIKRSSISSKLAKLYQSYQQLNILKQSCPNLTNTNEQLTDYNKELKPTKEKNTLLSQRLGNATLILLATTFLLFIPLILVYGGVIPLFLTPALVFTLFSVPPAIALLATLSLGIAAIVFYYKAHSLDSLINANTQTISDNTNQIIRNSLELDALEKQTIPLDEKQIKKDELIRDTLNEEFIYNKKLAEQYLNQAKTIEPISHEQTLSIIKPTAHLNITIQEEPYQKENAFR